MEHSSETPPVEATMTSARILGAIDEGGAGVTELASQLGMHKSTVYKHLSTLERIGFVIHDEEGYHLGSQLLQLGEATKRQHGLTNRVRPVVGQLAETTEEFVGFAVEYDHELYDVYTARGRLARQGADPPVTVRHLHCSAPGKAILAQFSRNRLTEYLDAVELSPMTQRTITDRDSLESSLERIVERDIAFDREEQFEGIHSVAVPYTDESLPLNGAIYVLGPADRMTGKRFEEDLPGMLHSAVDKM